MVRSSVFAHLSLVGLVTATHAASTTRLTYQYAPITWVENLAVRPNGLLLPITTTSPVLNQFDPATGVVEEIYDFSAAGNAIQGITAVSPSADVFVLNALTCNITALTCTRGSVNTWVVEFHAMASSASVRQIATFPEAGFLNGMAALSDDVVLMADSFLGGIWSLDISTGAKRFLFEDESMNGTEAIATGINGIRVRPNDGVLYFTNSARGTLNRIPIDPATGDKTGDAVVVETGLSAPDDFEVDVAGKFAYLANGAADQVLRIDVEEDDGEAEVVAEVPGPTSVRWGNANGNDVDDEEGLFVSTIGGLLQYVSGNVTVGGAVYEVFI